ncbi:MAG: hypothetical protein SF187_26180 [Deltaproteobacteria bacterium]|nr:hypothetical protein [Deltaproteobacteria bacterium]
MLRVHPRLPFECTYHFIAVGPQAFVMLDVIRSPRGNTLRLFVVQNEQLQHHEVIDEPASGGSSLSPTGDRITRSATGLNFDIGFSVKQSACAVAPLNPFGVFAITAKDHPRVVYNGGISFTARNGEARHYTLSNAAGTISQHYGRTLPEYLYFTTYPQEATPQLVGAISRVKTALGFRITSSYVSCTKPDATPRTVLSLRPRWRREDNGKLVIRSRLGEVEITLRNQGLAHAVDHENGVTWFDSRIFIAGITTVPLAGLFETRGPGWEPT